MMCSLLRRLGLSLLLALLAAPVWAISARDLPSQAEWLGAMRAGQSLSLPGKVMRTRNLFNNIAWIADTDPDGHWATPAELLHKGSGDLLDLVTAYYFTLRGMGVPASDLRMFFGKIRTLYDPVPHLLLAVRAGGTTYFIDPLRDTALTDETPSEFLVTLALNETGTWRTGALTDLSVWSGMGKGVDQVPRWMGVCYSTLGMLGLLAPEPKLDFAEIERNPPAAGVPAATKSRKKLKAKPAAKSPLSVKAKAIRTPAKSQKSSTAGAATHLK
jgi:predicted transglutaminase-like cysteine proteinase